MSCTSGSLQTLRWVDAAYIVNSLESMRVSVFIDGLRTDVNFTSSHEIDNSLTFKFTGFSLSSQANFTIAFSAMIGLTTQTIIENAVKLFIFNSDQNICLQSSDSLQVVYIPANLTGSLSFVNPERGLNTTVILKLSIPTTMVQKEGLKLDLYWPKEISNFLQQEFPGNFSQQISFHPQFSSGIGMNSSYRYLPISDGSSNLHFELGLNQENSILFSKAQVEIVFSVYLPVEVEPTMANMYGSIMYRSSPVALFSLTTPSLTPIGLEATQITGKFQNGELELKLVANQSLPTKFTLTLNTDNRGLLMFKESKSSSTCLDVSNVSNPAAVCNQTVKFLNDSIVIDDKRIDPMEIKSSEIRLSNPLLGIKLQVGTPRREVALKIHNLIFKNDFMNSEIEVKVALLVASSNPNLAQNRSEVLVKVISPCPKSCTSCSSSNPLVCYECIPGIAIQDKTCWLPLQRYHAFLSLQIVINSMIFILLCILGFHCYLAITASREESRYGLIYLTDVKMITSLLAYTQTIGVICYSFLSGNYLMVWASLVCYLSQVGTNIVVYFWLKKIHHCNFS
jgi:hypothetical protein